MSGVLVGATPPTYRYGRTRETDAYRWLMTAAAAEGEGGGSADSARGGGRCRRGGAAAAGGGGNGATPAAGTGAANGSGAAGRRDELSVAAPDPSSDGAVIGEGEPKRPAATAGETLRRRAGGRRDVRGTTSEETGEEATAVIGSGTAVGRASSRPSVSAVADAVEEGVS